MIQKIPRMVLIHQEQRDCVECPRDINPNLMAVQLLIDHKTTEELKQNFRIRSFNMSSPMRDKDLPDLSTNPLKTGIVITSDWKEIQERINKVIDVSKITEKIDGHKNFWAILPRKDSYFFWTNVEDEKALSKLIGQMKKLTELPDNLEVLTF